MNNQREIIDVDSRNLTAFETRLNRVCLENPDLPRSFVRNALLSMAELGSLSSPFIPRGSKK
jgi:indole-3-glycerol phosphate synthase